MTKDDYTSFDAFQHAERQRVAALIKRDKADRIREQDRQRAEIEVRDGVTVNLADTVIEPTDEWLAKGPVESFLPKQPKDTVRVIRTVKRQDVPHARKLMRDGVITLEGLMDCIWYANLHEMTGLAGSILSIDYGREVFAAPQSRSMFADWQVEKQDEFRFVRRLILARHLLLLDFVLLKGVPINRAVRAARAFHRRPKPAFAEAVEQLGAARKKLGGA